MVPQQDTPGTSTDVPKRSKKHFFRDIGKKQIIYIIVPLLLINAGIAHTIADQIKIKANAETPFIEVKDESTSADSADLADTDSTEESEIVSEGEDTVITTYVVKSGDTLSGIADKFNITINTIRWANDLTEKTSKINIGDELVILPVSGVEHTVKKGETLSGIAAKYDASQEDILKYNDIEKDAIKVGTELIIPGAEPIAVKAPAKKVVATKTTSPSTTTKVVATTATTKDDDDEKEPTASSSYSTPVHGILTQGLHDGNAVDFGVSVGTTVSAFKSGVVTIAKSSGYNGGYGNYIVISHEGSCQTQYSHLSSVSVAVGDKVSMGETIGRSGNTGRSTGPHLHFNARNCGGNPFSKFKIGTRF